MWWSPRDEEAAIRRRIRMRHYDLIVFGAVHRRHTWERFIDDVQRHYRCVYVWVVDVMSCLQCSVPTRLTLAVLYRSHNLKCMTPVNHSQS